MFFEQWSVGNGMSEFDFPLAIMHAMSAHHRRKLSPTNTSDSFIIVSSQYSWKLNAKSSLAATLDGLPQTRPLSATQVRRDHARENQSV